MVNKYYQKTKEAWEKTKIFLKKKIKNGEKKPQTDIKVFLKKKKKKKRQYHRVRHKNLSEEEKKNKVEYMINYYSSHKK